MRARRRASPRRTRRAGPPNSGSDSGCHWWIHGSSSSTPARRGTSRSASAACSCRSSVIRPAKCAREITLVPARPANDRRGVRATLGVRDQHEPLLGDVELASMLPIDRTAEVRLCVLRRVSGSGRPSRRDPRRAEAPIPAPIPRACAGPCRSGAQPPGGARPRRSRAVAKLMQGRRLCDRRAARAPRPGAAGAAARPSARSSTAAEDRPRGRDPRAESSTTVASASSLALVPGRAVPAPLVLRSLDQPDVRIRLDYGDPQPHKVLVLGRPFRGNLSGRCGGVTP